MDELTGVLETQKVSLEQVQVECQQAKQDCEAMKEVNVIYCTYTYVHIYDVHTHVCLHVRSIQVHIRVHNCRKQ